MPGRHAWLAMTCTPGATCLAASWRRRARCTCAHLHGLHDIHSRVPGHLARVHQPHQRGAAGASLLLARGGLGVAARQGDGELHKAAKRLDHHNCRGGTGGGEGLQGQRGCGWVALLDGRLAWPPRHGWLEHARFNPERQHKAAAHVRRAAGSHPWHPQSLPAAWQLPAAPLAWGPRRERRAASKLTQQHALRRRKRQQRGFGSSTTLQLHVSGFADCELPTKRSHVHAAASPWQALPST